MAGDAGLTVGPGLLLARSKREDVIEDQVLLRSRPHHQPTGEDRPVYARSLELLVPNHQTELPLQVDRRLDFPLGPFPGYAVSGEEAACHEGTELLDRSTSANRRP